MTADGCSAPAVFHVLNGEKKPVMRLPAKNAVFLFLAALIWGTAFVAQSVGMDYVGPFTFNACRYVIGSAVLLPLVLLRKRRAGTGIFSRNDLRAGAACGFFLAVASNLQQAGIMTTDVGKAGFLTAMYIVIVPVLHFFLTRRSSLRLWISAAIAAAGLYFLSISGSWTLETGDILLILCAFVFSLHILCIDHFSGTSDGVTVSCLQFLTAAVLSWAGALLTETVLWDTIRQAGPAILYAGVFSCGVAYTLQIIGQKGADPGPASLILSLESVVSVIAGFIFLGQALTARELLGCALMFLAIVLVQLPEKK